MVYKRKGGRHYFDGRLPDGRWKQLGTRTTSKPLAIKIEAMWDQLAQEHRAWDLLRLVLDRQLTVGRLYDLWVETRYSPREMRRRLRDVDLEPLVKEWHQHHARGVKGDSARHALAHVRSLLPEGIPCPAASIDLKRLTHFLTTYPGKRNTLRKVHSSLSVFFAYVTKVHGAYPANPMAEVDRPAEEAGPIRYYELDQVERIVGAQPGRTRRALMAFQYGTGVEVSVTLGLTRRDFDADRREVRAAGTKAHTRDRLVRVADWAWPVVWRYVRTFHPDAEPWGFLNRWTVSAWHRETVTALKLPAYPLHNARDHWAVFRLRAGAPVAVVQAQLGHGSPTLTLRKYGRFLPSGVDRDAIEQAATTHEQRRRDAQ